MKATIIHAAELSAELTQLWDVWISDDVCLTSPFVTHEFVSAFGRNNQQARIAVIEDGNKIVGFFLFEQRRFGLAQSLGYGLVDLQSTIVAPGYTMNLAEVVRQCRIDVFEFDRFAPCAIDTLLACTTTTHNKPVIDLENGWDEWFAQKCKRPNSRVKRIAQKINKIERELGPLAVTYRSTSHADLEKLMSWKGAQYVRTCRSNRFARCWFDNLLHELLDMHDDGFGAVLTRLDAGKQTVALDFGVMRNNELAGWFPTYDYAFRKYSPGLICWLRRIEAAAKSGITRIDLGVGEADYKTSFRDFDRHVFSGWYQRHTLQAAIRQLHRSPKLSVESFVLDRPALRTRARNTLKAIGSVRTKLHN